MEDETQVAPPRLAGRRGQAERNNTIILDAAREVFLEDPSAPIAAVAERAGVGFSALYRRYPRKEDLLRQLCHDGLRRYIAEAEQALAETDAWQGLTGFLARVVEADVHSLTVRLAGTFTPTEEMTQDAQQASGLFLKLVKRAHTTRELRSDASAADISLVLDGCAAIRVPDPIRTNELRARFLTITIAGLSTGAKPKLPGQTPTPEELSWRWRQR